MHFIKTFFILIFLFHAGFTKADLHDYFELPVGSPLALGISEIDYYLNIARFENEVGTDVLRSTGHNLEVLKEWDNRFFGAFAVYKEDRYKISLWGGMARAELMTNEVMVGILCHELGHIMGGIPKQTIPGSDWASAEGQSDFYAAKDCLPRLLKNYPFKNRFASKVIATRCGENLECQTIASIGYETVRFFQKWAYKDVKKVNFEVRPSEVVSKTLINTYPSDQCRLETYIAGAICSNPKLNCARPRCWYK